MTYGNLYPTPLLLNAEIIQPLSNRVHVYKPHFHGYVSSFGEAASPTKETATTSKCALAAPPIL
jgi:hypothetical protein